MSTTLSEREPLDPSVSQRRIVEYRGRAGLRELEADWRRLSSELPQRTRCHAYEAQAAYLDHLCVHPDKVRYLAFTDGDRVRAICPLEARTETSLKLPIPAWGLPFHPHWGVSDVLCPDDDIRRILVAAITAHLRRRPEGRPLLVLGPMPEGSSLWEGLLSFGERLWASCESDPSSHFDCEKTHDELLSRLSKHFRRNVRSHCNKVLKLGDARFVTASEPEKLAAELESFLTVEASGWKGAAGAASAIRLDPELTAFYRDLVRNLRGDDDHCEINSLYVGDACIASQFCVRTGGDYAILKIGYDEAYAKLGPGQVLMDATLRRCCEHPGIRRLDLGSWGPWQQDWHTEVQCMRQAHVAIRPVLGPPLVALVRFRFGRGRELFRWSRDRAGRAREAVTGACAAAVAGARRAGQAPSAESDGHESAASAAPERPADAAERPADGRPAC